MVGWASCAVNKLSWIFKVKSIATLKFRTPVEQKIKGRVPPQCVCLEMARQGPVTSLVYEYVVSGCSGG